MSTMRRMWPKQELSDIAKEANFNNGWNVKINKIGAMKSGAINSSTNGKPNEDNTYVYSDFIKIKPGSIVYFSKNNPYINYYTDDNFDSYVNTFHGSYFGMPATCKYIVYCIKANEFDENDVWSYEDFPTNPKVPFIVQQLTDTDDSVAIERLKRALNSSSNVHIKLLKFENAASWTINLAINEVKQHVWRGFVLSNDNTLEFGPGVKMEAIFDGSDRWIYENFSPFYPGIGTFTLINANIETQNTRYCVHDELSSTPEYCSHNYINCVMKNTETVGDDYYVQAIGGGLGANTIINIDGGQYYSFGGSTEDLKLPITYHNSNNTNASCAINIKNVYANGHMRFEKYGSSTYKTPIMISGCSTEYANVLNTIGSSADNMTLIQFNNEVRGKDK